MTPGRYGRSEETTAEVLDVYVDYLERIERGGTPDFDRLCDAHPRLAPDLRRVHANWEYVESVLERSRPRARDDAPSSNPPETVDRYRVDEVVARGGMATIWRAWDGQLERFVAMKVLDPAPPDAAPDSRAKRRLSRFLAEARIAARLDHPGIAPVYEIGSDGASGAYFTMKLVRGWTLSEIIDMVQAGCDGWTVHRALGIVLKVCDAVAYAHDKGVLHRDLKPSNVMVGRFGEVFVVDWGLARVTSDALPEEAGGHADPDPQSRAVQTLDGDVIGTPAYMSPEQANGRHAEIDGRTDVYAVGAILYHLLSGSAPYSSADGQESARTVLAAVKRAAPRPIATVAPSVPPELLSICSKALEREPAARYATMQRVADDLRAFLEGRVVSAFQTGPIAELRQWVRRNKLLAATSIAALSLFVVGAVGATVAKTRRDAIQAQVTRLSDLDQVRKLATRAAELWPIGEQHADAYRQWLADASRLRDVVGDGSGGGYRAALFELRKSAKERPQAEVDAELRAHPRHWELVDKHARVEVLLYSERVRDGIEIPTPAEIDWADYPNDPSAWVKLAWPLVHRTRVELGRETEGWALGERALAESNDPRVRAEAWYVLSWAFHQLGLDDNAVLAANRAADLVADDRYDEQVGRMVGAAKRTTAERREAVDKLKDEVAALSDEIAGRRTQELPDPGLQLLHDQLTELVDRVDALFDPENGLVDGTSGAHGWGIRRRLAFIDDLRSARSSAAWNQTIEAIAASPLYGGLRIQEQKGLVPLGPDPKTGLFEFAHLQTGEVAQRGESGELVISEETGLVLVLIPGGQYERGAQATDRDAANYDEHADEEDPVHIAELRAFFLAKYEMTQGQWERTSGTNPSRFSPGYRSGGRTVTLTHPVEEVSWEDCERVLAWLGLAFPTEAQWEYAARGRTNTPYWMREGTSELADAANLLDRSAKEGYALLSEGFEDWTDGYDLHAPVDRFPANAFGLVSVHGNVREWCFDAFQRGYRRWAFYAFEPVVDPAKSRWRARLYRIVRGGGFTSTAREARVSDRAIEGPDHRHAAIGLRPARALEW